MNMLNVTNDRRKKTASCIFHLLLLLFSASVVSGVEPGGRVTVTVGEIRTGSFFGRPLWYSGSVQVTPVALTLASGQRIRWTATDVTDNGWGAPGDNRYDKDNGRPRISTHEVNVTFTLNDDTNLFGATLTAHVKVVANYVADVAQKTVATQTLEKEVSFNVGTPDEIRSDKKRRFIGLSIASVSLIVVVGGAIVIARKKLKADPNGVMRILYNVGYVILAGFIIALYRSCN